MRQWECRDSPLYSPMTENSLTQRAAQFAANAHAGQTRRGSDTPYFTHAEDVARRVQELCDLGQADPAMVAAAYLHDTMEDCGTTHAELVQHFGNDVADLVAELTNDAKKKRRLGKTDYMVQKLSHLTPRALTIKLCDTLSNISDSPTPTQAGIYALIQVLLRLYHQPATWTDIHTQLSDAIINVYKNRFKEQIGYQHRFNAIESFLTREEIRKNMITWECIGLLITASKGMMNHWEDGTVTPDEVMSAFGAGKNRPRCEKCKYNWACTPFCHYTWNPEKQECYKMHRGFIPHDVYVGERPCPHFAPVQ